jgi:alkanesulfonate monooxygenase SsuD/methylene tetrahydromethanopterin reductase-like flavin-dependent oxidoreductase (luciferase family)
VSVFGISTYGSPPEYIVPVAKHAEQLGFGGVWVGEHILEPQQFQSVHPYDEGKARPPIVTRTRTMYDLWVIVGAIFGATRRLRVTSGVHLLPLRHPLLSARAAICAQQVSGGRFSLGVGSGWWQEEFDNLGVPFAERGGRYDEALRLLPKLFAGEVVQNAGPYFPFAALKLTDCPVRIPLVFGGTRGRALARAAQSGDGWYAPMVPPQQTIALKREVERQRAALGRHDPFSFQVRVRGEPSLDGLKVYVDAGFDTLVIPNETIEAEQGFEMTLEQRLRRLEVIAKALRLAN